ncbi:MAG: hypothetical protein R2769_12910 [Saprospiraceae bacterium]
MKKIFIALFCFSLFGFGSIDAQKTFFDSGLNNKALENQYQEALMAGFNADHQNFISGMQTVLEQAPDNFMANAHMAMQAFHTNDMDTFKKYAKKAVSIGAPNENTAAYEAVLKARLKEPKTDINQLVAGLIQNNMDVAEANFMQAMLYLENGDNYVAFEVLIRTNNMHPDFAPAYNALGYVCMDIDQMERAGKAFSKYMHLMPNYANAHDSMGDYFMAAGDYAKAKDMFEKAYALDNNFTFSLDKAKEAGAKL